MFFFQYCLWQIMTPPGRGQFGPRVTIGRNYKGAYIALLHTKYESSGPHGFREEDFFTFFPIISLWRPMTPGAWPTWTPGICLAGFIKGTTKRRYILNI